MNFLKKGPELKLPKSVSDVKVPGFLSGAYHELRERHLLPLVVVLVVGIIAVPIALREEVEPNPIATGSAAAGISNASNTQAVVAKSTPGLRDYKERLADLNEKDPFKDRLSRFVDESGEDGGEGEDGAGEAGAEVPGSESGSGTVYNPGEGTTRTTRTYYSWTIDVRVTPVSTNGKPAKEQPSVRRNQPELTMLPGRQTPAVVFIGTSGDGEKALMLVSSNVKGMFGDAICVLGGETCEMIALEKNVPQTFVYGGNERIFRLELLDVQLTESDKLNKAPLGEPGDG